MDSNKKENKSTGFYKAIEEAPDTTPEEIVFKWSKDISGYKIDPDSSNILKNRSDADFSMVKEVLEKVSKKEKASNPEIIFFGIFLSLAICLILIVLGITALSWARSTLYVLNLFVDVETPELFKSVYFLIFQIFMFFFWPVLLICPIIAFLMYLDKLKAKIEKRRLKRIEE